MGKLKEYIVDRWLTWRTGMDKPTRKWYAWYDTNVVYNASTVENMFMNFDHIVEVDWNKFFSHEEMGWWVPCQEAKQYFHPARELGNNAVWRIERVTWDQWDNRWHINEFSGADKVFVATNNKQDAVMIALKYS